MFKKYNKIYRLGKEETEGILIGTCILQEKIDGANTSIWIEDNLINCGSRNRHLNNEEFNGFVPYAQGNVGIQKLLNKYPNYRLYGEWLVKHTINYNEDSYRKFYLFDILDEENEQFLLTNDVNKIAKEYGIETPQTFGEFENPTIKQIEKFVGKTNLGEKGEGVVIKNFDFINKFGDLVYAKMVTQKFLEENSLTFNSNNKQSNTYWETYIAHKYITQSRIQKIMNKIEPEINERFDLKHIPRITNAVYHDMITEESWDIAQKVENINFRALRNIVIKKAKIIYVDILNNNIRENNLC